MILKKIYNGILEAKRHKRRLLAILVDPEKFELDQAAVFLRKLPLQTTHIFVGGSTVPSGLTETVVAELKLFTSKPIVLFPGDVSQLTDQADALLFLSLLSGNNPEYLVGQQVKAAGTLKGMNLEVIPTGYLLIDGGQESAVARVTNTLPLAQTNLEQIVNTARAAALMGNQLVYLEAGSGALDPVRAAIISAVRREIEIPIIVGGGIRTEQQMEQAYAAGADLLVMGTAFE